MTIDDQTWADIDGHVQTMQPFSYVCFIECVASAPSD